MRFEVCLVLFVAYMVIVGVGCKMASRQHRRGELRSNIQRLLRRFVQRPTEGHPCPAGLAG